MRALGNEAQHAFDMVDAGGILWRKAGDGRGIFAQIAPAVALNAQNPRGEFVAHDLDETGIARQQFLAPAQEDIAIPWGELRGFDHRATEHRIAKAGKRREPQKDRHGHIEADKMGRCLPVDHLMRHHAPEQAEPPGIHRQLAAIEPIGHGAIQHEVQLDLAVHMGTGHPLHLQRGPGTKAVIAKDDQRVTRIEFGMGGDRFILFTETLGHGNLRIPEDFLDLTVDAT